MRFKIDENLPVEVADLLVNEGYDTFTVNQQKMQGADDGDLIKVCKKEKRILITLDTDFSDIRMYPPMDYNGIMVLRSFNQSKSKILQLMEKILPELKQEKITHSLWIVEEDKIRIRQ